MYKRSCSRLKKISFLVFTIIVFLQNDSFSQSKNNFALNGKTKIQNIIDLTISNGFISSDFCSFKLNKNKNKIVKGEFTIQGNFNQPHAFRIITNTGSISALFFLDNSDQKIILDTLDISVTPNIINSPTNSEYVNNYLPLIKDLMLKDDELKQSWNDSISDSLRKTILEGRKNIREAKDVILFDYIKKHPNSNVGLWLLAENFSIYGYKKIYHQTYNLFSKKIKSTYCANQINKKLNISSISDLNGILPDCELKQSNNVKKQLKFKHLKTKYLLVDFWASFCSPCIKEFPSLLKIYNDTDRGLFDIISISIDSKKTINDWNQFIAKRDYPWQQFLDENKLFSKRLMINSVPSNFLIDSNGKIVLRNCTVGELEDFIKSNQ